jgi:hypothetical protein
MISPRLKSTIEPITAGSSAEIINFPVKARKRPTVRRQVKLPKNETRRRVRFGQLRRLLRDRCGAVLPNDDAGREYLFELLLVISLWPHEARRGPSGVRLWGPADKMRHAIEVWTPWMSENEASDLCIQITDIPKWERWRSNRALGEALGLTYGERARLKLKDILPYDIPEAGMALMRKRSKRQRERLRRQAQGAKSRAEYLAASLTRTKPWIAAGFKTRRTWERNGKPDVASPCQTKLSTKDEHALATKEEHGSEASECVRCPTATHPVQTGTCVNDGFLPASEAAWMVRHV